MTEDKQTLHTPIARLHRAKDRAARTWATHRGTDATLDAHGAAMVEAGERFHTAQEALTQREGEVATARLDLRGAIRELQHVKRGCLAEAVLAFADFDTSGLRRSDVADDAIAHAREGHGRVEARMREGEQMPHVTRHLEALGVAIANAERAVVVAHAADSALQTARDARYAAAVSLDDRLIAFRRIVRSVLGSKHVDYRRLRERSGGGEVDELELDAESPEAELDAESPEAELDAEPPEAELDEPASDSSVDDVA